MLADVLIENLSILCVCAGTSIEKYVRTKE